jgi:hypothetical protein
MKTREFVKSGKTPPPLKVEKLFSKKEEEEQQTTTDSSKSLPIFNAQQQVIIHSSSSKPVIDDETIMILASKKNNNNKTVAKNAETIVCSPIRKTAQKEKLQTEELQKLVVKLDSSYVLGVIKSEHDFFELFEDFRIHCVFFMF